MVVNDVYALALSVLDEINTGGVVNTDTGYEDKAPLTFDRIQRELAFYEGVNVMRRITSMADTLEISDDTALRVMPYAIAADFALQDKMSDEYGYCLGKYREMIPTIKREPKRVVDAYDILAGMQ